MTTVFESKLNAFPDSPYAAELKRGSTGRFSPKLEAEYVSAHLAQNRVLIRAACVLGAVLAGLRGMEQFAAGTPWPTFLIDTMLVMAGSILLAVISCSSAFQRIYLPWARIVVPLRNALIAAHVADAAARGQLEMLMALPIIVIGPFFFLGLSFRIALLSAGLALVSFLASAAMVAPPIAVISHAAFFMLATLGACGIAARQIEKRSRILFLETRLIAELAERDSLTWTKNRRVFDEHLRRLWPQAIDAGRAVSVLLIDIDHFKAYNDRYGHQAGDQALRQVAQTMQKFVQGPSDMLARYGGEEFAAVFYDLDAKQTLQTAERIRHAVQEARNGDASTLTAGVTISIGVAVVKPTTARDPEGAIQLADEALYDAKIKGRNRIELMTEVEHEMLVTGIFSSHSSRNKGIGNRE